MKPLPVYTKPSGSHEPGSKTAPEFIRVLEEAVLSELAKRGVLDDALFRRCMAAAERGEHILGRQEERETESGKNRPGGNERLR